MAEDKVLARCLGLAALGFVLMFVGHALGLFGWMVTEGRGFRLPYWWGYLLVYPAVAAVATRTRGSWRQTALCLCAPPVVYFLALGIFEGAWLASDGALWGSLATLALTACVTFLKRGRAPD